MATPALGGIGNAIWSISNRLADLEWETVVQGFVADRAVSRSKTSDDLF